MSNLKQIEVHKIKNITSAIKVRTTSSEPTVKEPTEIEISVPYVPSYFQHNAKKMATTPPIQVQNRSITTVIMLNKNRTNSLSINCKDKRKRKEWMKKLVKAFPENAR